MSIFYDNDRQDCWFYHNKALFYLPDGLVECNILHRLPVLVLYVTSFYTCDERCPLKVQHTSDNMCI